MVVVLGAFDGFHAGHRKLFEVAKYIAKTLKTDWSVLTFEPHPGLITGKIKAPLFMPIERELLRRVLYIPHLYGIKFDDKLRNFSPEEFLERLTACVKVDGIVVGDNFRFGFKREGSINVLRNFCIRNNLIYAFVKVDASDVSSTKLRKYMANGDMRNLINNLGYPWFMWTKVIRGNQRGRTLGFPTANLDISNRLAMPKEAVYAAAVPMFLNKNSMKWYTAVVSIGNNPTFCDVNELRAEVHITECEEDLDLYDKDILVFFFNKLRMPKRFENEEALIKQIKADIKRSKKFLRLTLAREDIHDMIKRFSVGIRDMTREFETIKSFEPKIISLDYN